MRRTLVATAILAGGFSAAAAPDRCGAAYLDFMERLSYRTAALSSDRLAGLHRKAVRIFHACDSGHLENAEAKFRNLDAG